MAAKKNGGFKVMVAIGGAGDGTPNQAFHTVVNDPRLRITFANTVGRFVGLYNLDGVDIGLY